MKPLGNGTTSYKAVIDSVYPMEEAGETHYGVDTRRKKGNVVLKITS